MKIDVAECIWNAEYRLTVECASPPTIFDNENGVRGATFHNWTVRDMDLMWKPYKNEVAFNASVCFAYWADGAVQLMSRDEDAVREFAALWELAR